MLFRTPKATSGADPAQQNASATRTIEPARTTLRDDPLSASLTYLAAYHGRAVIYLWAAGAMYGDFASLLDEVRATYPVAFIGSVGLMHPTTDPSLLRNMKALDGFRKASM